MQRRVRIAVIAAGVIFGAFGAGYLTAGPLDPPAGPVASSYKTLSEVEPRTAINTVNTPGDADSVFRISQPGSYYLTANVTGTSGKSGIEVEASNVSIDLNGFALTGVTGSLSGVSCGASFTEVSVRNGSARGWGGTGIRLEAPNSLVRDCAVTGCVGNGVRVGASGAVVGCSVRANGSFGISAVTGSRVSACWAEANLSGIVTGGVCAISNCSAYMNTSQGIDTDDKCVISGCTASNNGGYGIYTLNNSAVHDCTAANNSVSGIVVGDGCTITRCSATDNSNRGIFANNGCLISGCLTRTNASDGIYVNVSCDVRDNNCNGDGTVAAGSQGGIRVIGPSNRIEGNNITFADRGLMIVSSGNVIVRNSARACTVNFEIAAGNDVGPIGAAATATSPWANIQY